MGFGGSHSPGGVLAFEAMAALYIFGVRPIGMRARVFVQKALHSVPGVEAGQAHGQFWAHPPLEWVLQLSPDPGATAHFLFMFLFKKCILFFSYSLH